MNLLLDLGNSRLKWGLVDGPSQPIQARGSISYDVEGLQRLALTLNDVTLHQVCYASVVNAEREEAVWAQLPPGVKRHRFGVSPHFGTLRNAYATQSTLGIDRWAAAIGAWSKVNGACLVIGAGTATTIDLIDTTEGGGVYCGGLILPGIDLMLQSLHQGTARLPDARGRHRAAPEVPDNTQDAMVSGAIEATIGAIEQMSRRLAVGAPWVITGGHAQRLHIVLGQKAQIIEDLVLEGLAATLLTTN